MSRKSSTYGSFTSSVSQGDVKKSVLVMLDAFLAQERQKGLLPYHKSINPETLTATAVRDQEAEELIGLVSLRRLIHTIVLHISSDQCG